MVFEVFTEAMHIEFYGITQDVSGQPYQSLYQRLVQLPITLQLAYFQLPPVILFQRQQKKETMILHLVGETMPILVI